MTLNIAKEVAALGRITVTQLRTRYAEVFGEATAGNNTAWLRKRIAWRLQALARDADLRLSPPAETTATTPAPAGTISDGRPRPRARS